MVIMGKVIVNKDQMDEMITDIGREYEVGAGEQPPPLEV
jgi:hypothetical protein